MALYLLYLEKMSSGNAACCLILTVNVNYFVDQDYVLLLAPCGACPMAWK